MNRLGIVEHGCADPELASAQHQSADCASADADNPGTAAMARPRIVHVSGDFPDPVDSFKTPVIRKLLDLTQEDFAHEVISLNRRSPSLVEFGAGMITGRGSPRLDVRAQPFRFGEAISYNAPPKGLFHATLLRKLGDWLAERLRGNRRPDLLVGHKLTIEGIAVRRAAERLAIPFAICIQGDTDTKVLSARPDLARELREVYHRAAVLFPFTPWALDGFERRFGRRAGETLLLPCPTDLDTPLPPRPDGAGLVSVFHLKNYRRKNLAGMVAALRLLERRNQTATLEVIGGGSEREVARCRSLLRSIDAVALVGPLGRDELRQRLNRATGFILPSLRESYGLVFIEALFAGLPVIYPKRTAIDGYFDGLPFAIGVDASDPAAIAAAISLVIKEERALKAELEQWQRSEHARQFTREAIGHTFSHGLAAAVRSR